MPHLALAAVLAAVAACDRNSTAPAMPDGAAGGVHPVGPVPGPGDGPPGLPNPFANDETAMREGRRLFVAMNCSGCHGTHAGGGMGPSLRDASWIYGGEAADVFDSIAAGRARGMPAYGPLLPPEPIWQMVSYIHTLGTSKEIEPPR